MPTPTPVSLSLPAPSGDKLPICTHGLRPHLGISQHPAVTHQTFGNSSAQPRQPHNHWHCPLAPMQQHAGGGRAVLRARCNLGVGHSCGPRSPAARSQSTSMSPPPAPLTWVPCPAQRPAPIPAETLRTPAFTAHSHGKQGAIGVPHQGRASLVWGPGAQGEHCIGRACTALGAQQQQSHCQPGRSSVAD